MTDLVHTRCAAHQPVCTERLLFCMEQVVLFCNWGCVVLAIDNEVQLALYSMIPPNQSNSCSCYNPGLSKLPLIGGSRVDSSGYNSSKPVTKDSPLQYIHALSVWLFIVGAKKLQR